MFESLPVKYWKIYNARGCFLDMTGKKVLEAPSTMTATQRNNYFGYAVMSLNSLPMSQKPARAEYIPLGKELWRASRHRVPSDTRVITTGAI